MKPCTLPLAVLLFLGSSAAQAQIHIGIELGLPPIPHLVVVAPGVQVVEGCQEEIFFQGGWYWCRRPDGWYRSRSPRAHFDWVDGGRVPGRLRGFEPGRYRNWHHDGPGREDRGRDDRHFDHRHDEGRREDHGHHGEGEGHRHGNF